MMTQINSSKVCATRIGISDSLSATHIPTHTGNRVETTRAVETATETTTAVA